MPMRRGFLKYYLLRLLSEEALTGYGLMKAIEAETGFWKPSPGSLYPQLQALEDQDLIAHEGEGDRKIYHLTKRGQGALEEAYRAKAEILESLGRSLEVFARIFGEEEIEGLREKLESRSLGGAQGWERIPQGLRPRLVLLRQMLLSIPYEDLTEEQVRRINGIVEEALVKLNGLIEP